MMAKKTKRLYGRMQHGIEEKQAVIRTLENKRAAQEKSDSKAAAAPSKKSRSK
jgi:hypothetical protein